MLHHRSCGLSPLTQYGGTVGGIWFWHWSMVFVCRGSWWTVAPYTPTPVPGDEAGVAVGELSTMERDWAQDLSLSLFVIQFTEYFYCLQTFAFAHTHSAARKRCRIYYCSLHKLYYLFIFPQWKDTHKVPSKSSMCDYQCGTPIVWSVSTCFLS